MPSIATLLGVVAFSLVLAATDPPGPGLDPDAMAYMGAAESMAAHGKYTVPAGLWWSADSTGALVHFPPGYSTLLALPVRFGMAPSQAARLIEATAAAVTVTAMVFMVAEATTLLAGVLLALALFVTAAMHEVHASVLSEPLFLACTALTVAAMTRRKRSPLRLGLPAAFGAITRFAGLALVGAVGIWAFAERAPLRTRIGRALLTVLPALLLQVAWVVRTRRVGGPATIRRFALYGGLEDTILRGGNTLRDWLVPDVDAATDPIPYREWIAVAAAVVLLVLVAAGARRIWVTRRSEDTRWSRPALLLAACTLSIVCYLMMLFVSRLVADPGIPLDNRLLSPLFLLVSVVIATTLACWFPSDRREATSSLARVAVAGALLGWYAASAVDIGDRARYASSWGSDLAGEQWRESEMLQWARREGKGHPLYTNWPSAVYFHLHRPSYALPLAGDSASLEAFADTVGVRGGRVLAFKVREADVVSREQLRRVKGLRVVKELDDGDVLAATSGRHD